MYGLFTVEGEKSVAELFRSNLTVKSIFASRQWIEENKNQSIDPDIIHEASKKDMERMSHFTTSQEVIASVSVPDYVLRESDINNSFSIVLDDIRDPGNLGTICRIADWYGINTVICSETCVDFYNPKVISATMGSFSRVKVIYMPLTELLSKYTNLPVWGAVLNGTSIHESTFGQAGFILIGNESTGISEDLMGNIDNRITIPQFGKAESLNAAIATAVICDNLRRSITNR